MGVVSITASRTTGRRSSERRRSGGRGSSDGRSNGRRPNLGPSGRHVRPGDHSRVRGTPSAAIPGRLRGSRTPPEGLLLRFERRRSAPKGTRSAGPASDDTTATRRINVSRVVRVAAVSIVAMIAVAVAIQAQQVAGQQLLDEVRSEAHAQSRIQADLRAEVAEAEAPSALLHTAEELGMVEPGAVVAVPASGAVPSAPRDAAAAQERG